MSAGRREVEHVAAILADDLTGALDAAAPFADAGYRTAVVPATAPYDGEGTEVLVASTGARDGVSDGSDRRQSFAAYVARHRPSIVGVKIDSVLRGDPGGELASLSTLLPGRGPFILCPALPQQGRVVRDGLVEVHGRPLAMSGHHDGPAPTLMDVARDSGMTVRHIDIEKLRSDGIGSTSAGEPRQSVLVVDALTDGDLDLVVGSAPHDDIVWAGSAGLYAALARQARRSKRVLVVCGSASPMAARQVSEVRASGAETFVIDHDLDAGELGHVEEALGRGGVVVLAAPEREAHSVLEGSHAGRLAETAAGIVGVDGYVFVGGHTAERCFAALGVGFAEIAGVADPGTALGRFSDPDGRPFVSKAGSFGDEASLVRAIRAVRSLMTRGPE